MLTTFDHFDHLTDRTAGRQVRVWSLAALEPERTLRRPGASVNCLAVAGGEVWGGVGREVVVWGRL